MSQQFYIKELANGLTLLGQRMEHVSSVAMSLLVEGGAAQDPAGMEGAASIITEWCLRGAGGRDSRQLNDELDALGCQHSENVLSEHIQFSAAQLGRNLGAVLAIYADIVRRPRFEDSTFDPCRDLTMQDLASLEDEPSRKCNMLLREKFYPRPLGRCVYGRQEALAAIEARAVREHALRNFTPNGAILAVAGDIRWQEFCDLAQRQLGDWAGDRAPRPKITPAENGVTFIQKDTAQVHLALAHKSAPAPNKHYYAARLAESVLSGGMSSRLGTEVREKRGLVYHVSSRYHSLKDHAGMFTYAGTVPQRAQETLEVVVAELRRLAQGIEESEMQRSRTQLKSALVMQGESTTARAGTLMGDWYHLRRLRSLEELSRAIDSVTVRDVLDYLTDYPANDFTLLVVGPQPLDTSVLKGAR